jgi:hypothetical protein
MALPTNRIHPRPAFDPAPANRSVVASSDPDALPDSLVDRAEEAQAEQAALLEATPLESQYCAALAAQVQAKHDQVDRIEDRLENLVEQQGARLQQAQAQQPGLFALPGARARWQRQLQQQQCQLQRLHGRLEHVREIRDGMAIQTPRIEDLAHRKLRAQEPELAAEWDTLQEAQRRHQALIRKQEQDRKRALQSSQREGPCLTLRLPQPV